MKKSLFLTLLLCYCYWPTYGQDARGRSVQLSAETISSPPSIQLNWVEDPAANQYLVYRKGLEEIGWGDPIAVLPGAATTFTDTNVEKGIGYEYGLFKKGFDVSRDTFCLEEGTSYKFTINSIFGYGLCCSFQPGWYEVNGCGQTYASGADFGFSESTDFTTCTGTGGCVEVELAIRPDMFPHETTWALTSNATGAIIADSGPFGSLIEERPTYGYIYTGIELPALEDRGTILLLTDDVLGPDLLPEIHRTEMDMVRDGWHVIRRSISREEPVTAVKALIQSINNDFPNLKGLFLIGHIPVPYSGDIYPDTHSEHRGAWAADVYYADLDGIWTDETVNRATAFFAYNHNVPGDGKFDQGFIPSEVELQAGRVDFYDMPTFPQSELELMRKYLDKNHAFRNNQIPVQFRGLVDDNFMASFAAPAATAYRNFSTMFGPENVDELDYFTTLRENSYMWSYGCGSGTHISSAGIGSTWDFAFDSLQTVFTILFGSQFGDWDNVNNFLRAPLASGQTLTNCWAGNPPWTLHHMSMGYHIGYSTVKTQNSTLEDYLPGPQLTHVALLGDPTLRMHYVEPPQALELINRTNGIEINWTGSVDPEVDGYYLYRAGRLKGPYEKLSDNLLTDGTFFDDQPLNEKNYYLLRARKLETTPSGSFYNLSPGTIDSTKYIYVNDIFDVYNAYYNFGPNPTGGMLVLNLAGLPDPDYQLQIINVSGAIVLERTIPSNQETQLDLGELPNGVYVVAIKGEQFAESRKLILQKE